MATKRLSMRQIREILRQKWALSCSHRQVATSLGVSLGTISSVYRGRCPVRQVMAPWARVGTKLATSPNVLCSRINVDNLGFCSPRP